MTLAGPHYASIDASFALARQFATPRTDIGRILVFFGASDSQGLTEHALRVLSEPLFSRVHLDVVIGVNAPLSSNIERLARLRGRTVLHEPQSTLAPLMLRADLMIGAAGMTSWERCALGLPSIAAVVAENQQRGAALLVAEGAARSIDLRSSIADLPAGFEQQLTNALSELLAMPDCLAAMSENAFRLTDGCGATRVAEVLLPTSPDATSLRPATEADSALLFRWANDPDVRRASFHSEPIGWDEHIAWCSAVISDPSSRIWILETQDSLPVGQFRVSVEDGAGVVDYSVDSDFRGRGLGRRLLEVGLDAWRQTFPTVPLRAETTLENRRSRAALAAAGWKKGQGGDWTAGGANLDSDRF
jgi:RimJ/RimL family protein N-acetyltransferase